MQSTYSRSLSDSERSKTPKQPTVIPISFEDAVARKRREWKATDILRLLKEEGYEISEATLRKYISKLREYCPSFAAAEQASRTGPKKTRSLWRSQLELFYIRVFVRWVSYESQQHGKQYGLSAATKRLIEEGIDNTPYYDAVENNEI